MEKKEKSLVGHVISDKMDKTVGVAIELHRPHPLYKKIIRRRIKLVAHDENNSCHQGDLIRIVETRPLSKTKRWRVVEILSADKSKLVLDNTELDEEKK